MGVVSDNGIVSDTVCANGGIYRCTSAALSGTVEYPLTAIDVGAITDSSYGQTGAIPEGRPQ